jgi:acyl-CoA-binding protein
LDGVEVSQDTCTKSNVLIPSALYDSGSEFSFSLMNRTFRCEVHLHGSILSEQYYTYHLLVDGRIPVPAGAPGTLIHRFTEAVELMKKLKPKFELKPEEKLRLNSLYNHSKHGECTIEKPNMIDVSGIEQWNAWKSLSGKAREETMSLYIKEAFAQVQANNNEVVGVQITKAALVNFYLNHDPESVERVDSILEAYTSAELLRALSDKYAGKYPVLSLCTGADAAGSIPIEKSTALTGVNIPSPSNGHAASAAPTLAVAKAAAAPPPAPAPAPAPVRAPAPAPAPAASNAAAGGKELPKEMFTAFYQKHDPASIPRVEMLLEKFTQQQLLDAMQQKYGETPGHDGTSITRVQLESFYAKHDPSVAKLPGRIDQLLQANTADLITALKQKYGESPVPQVPGAVPAGGAAAGLV